MGFRILPPNPRRKDAESWMSPWKRGTVCCWQRPAGMMFGFSLIVALNRASARLEPRDTLEPKGTATSMTFETILWRRLDTPGHDACRLVDQGFAWRIEGVSVFRHETGPAALVYEVECDRDWRTREGTVNGWVGSRQVSIRVTRSSIGVWTLNGEVVPSIQESVDLDLGFTPATNLPQLRRIALQVGQSADAPVAWLDVPFGSLEVLQQRY